MGSARSPSSTALRLLLLGAASVMVVGGGLPTLHLASHRHAICPEDGDVVDNDVVHSVDHTGHVASEHVDPDPQGEGRDSHCGVLGALGPNAHSSRVRPDIVAAHQVQLASPTPRARLTRTLAPLAHAPKTSPPA